MKRLLLIITIFLLAGGTSFAQYEYYLKNTVTIDAYMLLLGPAFSRIITSSPINFIGTALQYERQINNLMSFAGRIAYRAIFLIENNNGKEEKMINSGISAEAHYRIYPLRKTLFLDGMLGYANYYYYDDYGIKGIKDISHYFIFGGRIGWRFYLYNPGGLILEPSFGYHFPTGTRSKDFITYRQYLLSLFAIAGGPQVSIALGYSF